jgi:hypothetical protein
MEANSIGGDTLPEQDHIERKWSEAELEMIHAAMMVIIQRSPSTGCKC